MKRYRQFLFALLLLQLAPSLLAGELRVLGLFKDMAILEIDGTRHKLRPGESTPGGLTLIRADSESALIEQNGERREVKLGSHIGSSFKPPQTRQVLLYPDPAGMYRTGGQINGQRVNFLVDTGATNISMNADTARRLHLEWRGGRSGMAETASGVVPVNEVILDRVTVGEITLRNVPALVINGSSPRDILLGMSFLGRVEMQRQGTALLLKKNH